MGISPQVEIARDKFAAIVDPDRPGIADLGTDPFQCPDQILTAVCEARVSCWTQAGERVRFAASASMIPFGGQLALHAQYGP